MSWSLENAGGRPDTNILVLSSIIVLGRLALPKDCLKCKVFCKCIWKILRCEGGEWTVGPCIGATRMLSSFESSTSIATRSSRSLLCTKSTFLASFALRLYFCFHIINHGIRKEGKAGR